MALDIDSFIDRRQLRRKVSFWRIGALLAIAVAVIAVLAAAGAFSGLSKSSEHIARVAIKGVITEDKLLLEMLEKIRKDENVKGVILNIDSPGGTTVGGEAIYEAVRKIAKDKPVATSVGTLAASAGYMIASASDHIVARRSSIVGSIGVIFQYPQVVKLLDKVGVEVKDIKSSPLKAEPSPFSPTPPGAVTAMQQLVDDSYKWFVDLVTERRPLDRAAVLRVADGRVFSGDRGLKLKLIDALGGEEVAKEWLIKEKGLNKDLKLIDWAPQAETGNLLFGSVMVNWVASQFGLSTSDVESVVPDHLKKRLFLDGLLSIWHGEAGAAN